MFGIKRVVVGDGERALLYKNRRFKRVLIPGVYRFWNALGEWDVRSFEISRSEFTGNDVDALAERLGAELKQTFVLADVGVDEIGLVSKHGKLADALAPGTRKLYWISSLNVSIEKAKLSADLLVPDSVAKRLRQLGLLDSVAQSLTVPAESAGLVFIDGKLARKLVWIELERGPCFRHGFRLRVDLATR